MYVYIYIYIYVVYMYIYYIYMSSQECYRKTSSTNTLRAIKAQVRSATVQATADEKALQQVSELHR